MKEPSEDDFQVISHADVADKDEPADGDVIIDDVP